MGDDKIDDTVNGVTASVVGIVMICSVLIPIACAQIAFLNGLEIEGMPDISQYIGLIEIAVVMVIIGLIIAVIKTYSRSGE